MDDTMGSSMNDAMEGVHGAAHGSHHGFVHERGHRGVHGGWVRPRMMSWRVSMKPPMDDTMGSSTKDAMVVVHGAVHERHHGFMAGVHGAVHHRRYGFVHDRCHGRCPWSRP